MAIFKKSHLIPNHHFTYPCSFFGGVSPTHKKSVPPTNELRGELLMARTNLDGKKLSKMLPRLDRVTWALNGGREGER